MNVTHYTTGRHGTVIDSYTIPSSFGDDHGALWIHVSWHDGTDSTVPAGETDYSAEWRYARPKGGA